jgi:hypothetical protein
MKEIDHTEMSPDAMAIFGAFFGGDGAAPRVSDGHRNSVENLTLDVLAFSGAVFEKTILTFLPGLKELTFSARRPAVLVDKFLGSFASRVEIGLYVLNASSKLQKLRILPISATIQLRIPGCVKKLSLWLPDDRPHAVLESIGPCLTDLDLATGSFKPGVSLAKFSALWPKISRLLLLAPGLPDLAIHPPVCASVRKVVIICRDHTDPQTFPVVDPFPHLMRFDKLEL